jgi:F0F1-type ATP synthase assembly protein I
LEDPRRGPRIDPELLRHLKFFGTISLDLASGSVLGFAIGRFVDLHFGTTPIWSSICFIVGTGIGFYGVFRLVMIDVKRRR